MSIQLGALVFTGPSKNVVWEDRDAYSNVVQQRRRTLGGSQVIWHQTSTGGRPITLSSLQDQGWFSKTQKDAIIVMADQAGATFSLTIGASTYSVVFRHDEPPAVEFTPLIGRAVDLSEDYFLGTIKLVTI